MDYFAIFGLEPHPDLSTEDLLNKYLELQARHHPDVKQSVDMDDYIDKINLAYQTLNDEYSRMVYILELKNIILEDIEVDQDFLQELVLTEMGYREADIPSQFEMTKQISATMMDLMQFAKRNIIDGDYQSAALCLVKCKFYSKIIINNRETNHA